MRQILYKNMTSNNQKKHHISVSETVEKDGILARTDRYCKYYIKDRVRINSPYDYKKMAAMKLDKNSWKKKHFHILRNYNTKTGEDSLVCKVAGSIYAVIGNYIYSIAFLHKFKVNISVLLQ